MRRAVLLLCCVLLGACDNAGPSEQEPDAGVDAGTDASVASRLPPAPMGGGFCCPVDPTPNCHALPAGGWVAVDDPSRCSHVADAAPPYQSSLDEHGCEVLSSSNFCNVAPHG